MIYTIIGTERYIIEHSLKRIKKKYMSDDTTQIDVVHFDMNETLLDEALYDAQVPAFFSDYKMLVIDNPYFLTGQNGKKDLPHNIDMLQAYVENPLDTTILVIIADYEKMDERKKIVKVLKKASNIFEAYKLNSNQASQWLKNMLDKQNIAYEHEAIESIVSRTDADLQVMVSEIKKYQLMYPDQTISLEIVEDATEDITTKTVFELIEAIVNKEASKSIDLYQTLLEQSDDPIAFIALMSQQLKVMLQLKLAHMRGYNAKDVARILAMHPYRVKKIQENVSRFSEVQMQQALTELIDLDYQIKTGTIDKFLGFELFIIRFTTV
ncbi:DNA polymerase III subunit delta [Culicoidibacter larvae]|uniref:DNA polymerase III subunit delta n=1 Tax=Culicoidibacter larvae TaxID=2579976 RepID=A0A5R8QCQ3_9FIRM|nr:DNA polymerase III subunit delta [Culicoidibacter larvae]TLG74288.1 DNA polymerase III subunit delta [Culicoidibacter larvae]